MCDVGLNVYVGLHLQITLITRSIDQGPGLGLSKDQDKD